MSPSEEITPSTGPAKPATKKRFSPYFWLFAGLLIFILPGYSLQKYSEILVSTPAAPVQAQADCGVVLTGGAGRIREAIALLSNKQIQKLVISGVHQHSMLNDMIPEILFYPEIKLENVILERRSSSTAGNAQQSLPIVEALNCQSILLITSDYHMYRALKTFTQAYPAAIKIIPYPIASERLKAHRAHAMGDLKFWGAIFEEWYKYVFYSVFVF